MALSKMGLQLPHELDVLAIERLSSESPAKVEQFLELLVKIGVARYFRVHASTILVHPKNRDGIGICAYDVHQNLADICDAEWHDGFFKGCITDISPDMLEETLQSNEELVQGSKGMLAPIDKSIAQYMTLRGSHTNQGHRLVLASWPHFDVSITNNGKLSRSKVVEKSPSMEQVLQVGANYLLIPSWVLAKYPGMDLLIQSSGNVVQNIAKIESDIQQLAKVGLRVRNGLSYQSIKEAMTKNKCKNPEALPGMFNFVRKFAGGAGVDLLKQSLHLIRGGSDNNQRQVSADTWDHLQTDWKGAIQTPRVRHGILAILYSEKNEKLVNVSDIKKLGGKDVLPKVLTAETHIEAMWKHMDAHWLCQHPGAVDVFGQFQMAVAAHVLGKCTAWMSGHLAAYQLQPDSLHFGILEFWAIADIEAITKLKVTCVYDVHTIEKKVAPSTKGIALVTGVRDADVDLTDTLMTELGWVKGNALSKKDLEGLFTLLTWSSGNVTLVNKKSGELMITPITEFQGKLWKKEAELQDADSVVIGPRVQQLHVTKDFVFQVIRSHAYIAVAECFQWQEGTEHIKVTTKPKSVEAIHDIAKNKLVLAPSTLKIVIKEPTSPPTAVVLYSNNGLYLGSFMFEGKSMNVYATAVQSAAHTPKRLGLFCPFFSIQTTSNQSEANCVLTENLSKFTIKVQEPQLKVPMIKVTAAVKKGSKLFIHVPENDQQSKKRKAD